LIGAKDSGAKDSGAKDSGAKDSERIDIFYRSFGYTGEINLAKTLL